ncbi:MAG: hypothetical protein RJB66_1342 [Pseudomonadota bacterium]
MKYLKVLFLHSASAFLVCGFVFHAQAKSSLRIVKCDESKMIDVIVRPNFGTIINFPVKPDNVVLGGPRQFAIEYIKNDLALTALSSTANTNLFVYLLGRRCGFHLLTSGSRFDNLVQVRDPEDAKIKVPFE